jgi:acyl-CoA synthetase (AMP-forming)/AMP-acid ligase II
MINQVGMGGSAIPAAVAERAESLGIKLLRSYGSTEHPSTTGSTFDDSRHQRNYTDGIPMPGVEVRLIDDDGNDLEEGPGEIWCRGPDLFVGYTNPVLTKAAIDPDGWFATGDIAVRDEHGCITITDRKKDIIIRGGENISAAEVEAALYSCHDVAEAAVFGVADDRLGEVPVAVIHAQPESGLDEEGLRAFLQGRVAAFKIPARMIFTDAPLPRLGTGKIDRVAIREKHGN